MNKGLGQRPNKQSFKYDCGKGLEKDARAGALSSKIKDPLKCLNQAL